MKIEVVSDIACPWCAVGVWSLDRALANLGPDFPVDVSFHPFELNPDMGPEGADTVQYLCAKYGITPEQVKRNREGIKARGAAVGFAFGERGRVWSTFDAHRLLHWAGLEGKQRELKRALLTAYHGKDLNPSDPDVLAAAATEAGLDADRARKILASDEFTAEVRQEERAWTEAGISAVPSFVIAERYLVQGAQSPEALEQALREVAAKPAGDAISSS